MKFYRLIGTLLLLESKNQITAKELAERFEVSVRTIYRDLDILCQAGIPIVTESGAGGGISLMESYQFKINTFNQNELESMVKILADTERLDLEDDNSKNMLLKVRNNLPSETQLEFDRFMRSIKIDTTSWFGKQIVNTGNAQLLDSIKKSILEKKKLAFDYSSYQRVTQDRIVHPYGLVKKAQAWYLVGYCEERSEIRVFNVMRIQNLRQDDKCFEISNTFSLDDYWEAAINGFQEKTLRENRNATKLSKAEFPVTLKCHEKERAIVAGFNLLYEEKIGELCILCVDLISESIAMQQLLLNLDTMIILEPEALKENILYKVKKILQTQSR